MQRLFIDGEHQQARPSGTSSLGAIHGPGDSLGELLGLLLQTRGRPLCWWLWAKASGSSVNLGSVLRAD